jgi:putative transposase
VIWPVELTCEALGVSRSGFYAWLTRVPSARSVSDAVIGQEVRTSFLASDRTYGVRRVWRDVASAGHHCGLQWSAPNILDRQFTASAPNEKWAADFTFLWTAEGWLYVAVVLDLYSRRVVGWSMQPTMTSQLVTDALTMAVWRRGGKQTGEQTAPLHHSDRGSQYTSESFQRLLGALGVTCSMSRSGNVRDNSAMESFFSSLKTERTARKMYRTRNAARADVFDYIERFYNPIRRHSTLGYLSPIDFEQQARTQAHVA